jgi:SAM-dependent methyltransferase
MAGSQFGVMLFGDMPKGIAEMARVVRPGGRVLMNVYGDPHAIEFLGVFVAAVQAVVPSFEGPPMDPLPLPFQLHDPERLRHELAEAGLEDVEVETITEATEFRSGEHLWDWLVHSNPIVAEILGDVGLTEDQTAVVRDAVIRVGATVLTAPINIGVGTR